MGYPKHIFKRANEELARRREAARMLGAHRSAEIAERIPEIAQIQRDMAESAMAVTRLITTSSDDLSQQIDALKNKSLALQRQRAELLTAAGYPADYLAEQAACEKCGGGGYIGADICDCFRELLKREAYTELSGMSQVKNSTFADFRLDYYPVGTPDGAAPRAHMSDVFNTCISYAESFSLRSPSLLLLGHTGLGKTHLSLAIAGAVTENGFGAVYTSVQKLMDKLEAHKFSYAAEAKEQYARDLENVLGCDLLVLDDLGAEFLTNFSSSALYNIVNTRLVESRPTIISTNLDPAGIEEKYSPRMLSRLIGGYTVMKFLGKDIRFMKKMRQ